MVREKQEKVAVQQDDEEFRFIKMNWDVFKEEVTARLDRVDQKLKTGLSIREILIGMLAAVRGIDTEKKRLNHSVIRKAARMNLDLADEGFGFHKGGIPDEVVEDVDRVIRRSR